MSKLILNLLTKELVVGLEGPADRTVVAAEVTAMETLGGSVFAVKDQQIPNAKKNYVIPQELKVAENEGVEVCGVYFLKGEPVPDPMRPRIVQSLRAGNRVYEARLESNVHYDSFRQAIVDNNGSSARFAVFVDGSVSLLYAQDGEDFILPRALKHEDGETRLEGELYFEGVLCIKRFLTMPIKEFIMEDGNKIAPAIKNNGRFVPSRRDNMLSHPQI